MKKMALGAAAALMAAGAVLGTGSAHADDQSYLAYLQSHGTMPKPTLAAMAAAALLITVPLSPIGPKAPLSSCGGYINVDGNCVPSPDHTRSNLPDRDGTWSHSEHKQGSGSHHGGTGRSK